MIVWPGRLFDSCRARACLIDFGTADCADRRDKAFGLLAIVDWEGLPPMIPSYTDTSLLVALRVLSYSCRHTSDQAHETSLKDVNAFNMLQAPQAMAYMGIGPNDPDTAAVLLSRRGIAPETRNKEPRLTTPQGTDPHVVVMAESCCLLYKDSNKASGLFTTLADRGRHQEWRGISKDRMRTIWDEWTSNPGSRPYRLVSNASAVQALVPIAAQAGDLILKFHTNATPAGLLARKSDSSGHIWNIVGQVVFSPFASMCPGGTKCSCGLSQHKHATAQYKIDVKFDPLDLLLYLCQDIEVETYEALTGLVLEHGKLQPSLTPLRLQTSVVRLDDPRSSFVESRVKSK